MIHRRQAIVGLSSLLAAPAIARTSSLMRISPIIPSVWIKDVNFSYRHGTLAGSTVVFSNDVTADYRSERSARRVMRQVAQQISLTDLPDGLVGASFGCAPYRYQPFVHSARARRTPVEISYALLY